MKKSLYILIALIACSIFFLQKNMKGKVAALSSPKRESDYPNLKFKTKLTAPFGVYLSSGVLNIYVDGLPYLSDAGAKPLKQRDFYIMAAKFIRDISEINTSKMTGTKMLIRFYSKDFTDKKILFGFIATPKVIAETNKYLQGMSDADLGSDVTFEYLKGKFPVR